MFDLEKSIAEWRRQMAADGIQTPELLDELESHLRDDVEQQMRSGLSAQRAFEVAVQKIGEAGALKQEFKKVGGTKLAVLQRLKRVLVQLLGGKHPVPFPPLNNFNLSARQTLELARAEAPRFHHDFIGTEHILLGLLAAEGGTVSNVLQKFGVDREAIRTEIEKIVGTGPDYAVPAAIPFTPRARKALLLANSEANALNHAQVGTEHIFLGLLSEGAGVAALVLKNLGVQTEKAREEIVKELDPRRGNR